MEDQANGGGTLTRDEMEQRRLAAASLFESGFNPSRVGELFGVSRTTAYRWVNLFRDRGAAAMKKHVPPGRPSRLDRQQLAALRRLCGKGPRANGYARDDWTTSLLADAILKQFRVRYDPDHVGRLLRRMGIEWRVTPKRGRKFTDEERRAVSERMASYWARRRSGELAAG